MAIGGINQHSINAGPINGTVFVFFSTAYTIIIDADDRTLIIDAENRNMVLMADGRVLYVDGREPDMVVFR